MSWNGFATNSEFLNVLIAEPFDLELAEDVADRVLAQTRLRS